VFYSNDAIQKLVSSTSDKTKLAAINERVKLLHELPRRESYY
jgi:hypothetical protein